jgi:penicillin-binding protein 2
LRHQSWFIGYAPADNPTIAVAVAVEHGGFGSSTAAPIARKIMDAWLLGTMPAPPKRTQAGGVPGADFGNVHGAANRAHATRAAVQAPTP